MERLTELEKSILVFIKEYLKKHGYAPTYREIAEGCFISVSVAHKYCCRLYYKGVINLDQHKSRSITLKTNIC